MSVDKIFDVSKVKRPSYIIEEVLQKISAEDAVHLRGKFGGRLCSNKVLKALSKKFLITT